MSTGYSDSMILTLVFVVQTQLHLLRDLELVCWVTPSKVFQIHHRDHEQQDARIGTTEAANTSTNARAGRAIWLDLCLRLDITDLEAFGQLILSRSLGQLSLMISVDSCPLVQPAPI
jgi:hypothetical protein